MYNEASRILHVVRSSYNRTTYSKIQSLLQNREFISIIHIAAKLKAVIISRLDQFHRNHN